MAKKDQAASKSSQPLSQLFTSASDDWESQITAVSKRFNQEYRREAFELPAEVEAMPIFREWAAGSLQTKTASPFWKLAQPQKNQHCLDIGCGLSFLIYPWRDWGAFFHGQEISTVAQEALNSRGPQLNSKLYKGVELGPAHQLRYQPNQFDLAIATGFSCYFSLDYWEAILAEVRRVLKPGGIFVFDLLNPEAALAENWAILETYLGAEVFLESLSDWEKMIKTTGAEVIKTAEGELFQLYKVHF